MLYSFLDWDRIPGSPSFEDVLKGHRFGCNWRDIIFPVGALEAPKGFAASPAGAFKVLVCKIAAGSTLAHQDAEGMFRV